MNVTVPALHLNGTLVAVVPSSTPGGETRYAVEWFEAHDTMPRYGGFWWEDFDDDTRARLAALAVAQAA